MSSSSSSSSSVSGLVPFSLGYVLHRDDSLLDALFFAPLTFLPYVIVIVMITYIVTAHRSLEVIYQLIGILLSTGINIVLKQIIRQPRPPSSHRDGFGMPSDHSQFCFFIATYFIYYLFRRHKPLPIHVSPFILTLFTLCTSSKYHDAVHFEDIDDDEENDEEEKENSSRNSEKKKMKYNGNSSQEEVYRARLSRSRSCMINISSQVFAQLLSTHFGREYDDDYVDYNNNDDDDADANNNNNNSNNNEDSNDNGVRRRHDASSSSSVSSSSSSSHSRSRSRLSALSRFVTRLESFGFRRGPSRAIMNNTQSSSSSASSSSSSSSSTTTTTTTNDVMFSFAHPLFRASSTTFQLSHIRSPHTFAASSSYASLLSSSTSSSISTSPLLSLLSYTSSLKSPCPSSSSSPSSPSSLTHTLSRAFLSGLSLSLASLVAYSRVRLGVHSAMQVAVGALVGVTLGAAWGAIAEKWAWMNVAQEEEQEESDEREKGMKKKKKKTRKLFTIISESKWGRRLCLCDFYLAPCTLQTQMAYDSYRTLQQDCKRLCTRK